MLYSLFLQRTLPSSICQHKQRHDEDDEKFGGIVPIAARSSESRHRLWRVLHKLPAAIITEQTTTTTTTTALSMVDDHARRRACWTTVTAAAAALWLLPTTAHAGLLEEFGTDPKNLNAIPAKAATTAPVAATNVQIDPSLKGCKSGLLACLLLLARMDCSVWDLDGCKPCLSHSTHTRFLFLLRLTVRF